MGFNKDFLCGVTTAAHQIEGAYNEDNLEDMKIIIDEIRQTLSTLIDERHNLLDVEVINISQKLDDALNKYNNLLEKSELNKKVYSSKFNLPFNNL